MLTIKLIILIIVTYNNFEYKEKILKTQFTHEKKTLLNFFNEPHLNGKLSTQ